MAWGDGDQQVSAIDAALGLEGVTGKAADFVRSLYQQESGSGANTTTSNRGAVGGMQIIPSTFNSVADPGMSIHNPVDNARAGTRYALQMLDAAGGDPRIAAAGYYGGPGGLAKARAGVAVSDPVNPNAPNTLQYGDQVAARMSKGTSMANSNWGAGDQVVDTNPTTPAASAWGANDKVVLGGTPSSPATAPTGPGAGESALRGAIQGATLGFGDEIQAGIRSAIPYHLNVEPNAPKIFGLPIPTLAHDTAADGDTSYAGLRDAERAQNQAAYAAHPGAYIAGDVAGALPSYAAGGSLKAVQALGLVKGGAAVGGTLGAVQGLGGAQGDASDQIGQTIKGGAIGAAVGAATPIIAKPIQNVAQRVIDRTVFVPTKAPTLQQVADQMGVSTDAQVALQAFRNSSARIAAENAAGQRAVAAPLVDPKITGAVTTAGLAATGLHHLGVGVVPEAIGALAGYGIGGGKHLVNDVANAVVDPVLKRGSWAAAQGAKGLYNPTFQTAATNTILNSNAPGIGPRVQLDAPDARTRALQSMSSGQQAAALKQGEAQIQQKVDSGQPAYAANFTQLSTDPAYRAAANKAAGDDQDDEEDGDE